MRKGVLAASFCLVFVSGWGMAFPTLPNAPLLAASLPIRSVSDLLDRAIEIRFEQKSLRLLPSSHPFLDALARQLAIETTVNIEIGVHVTTSGNAKRDLTFSKSRAEIIKRALVDRGVSPQRLETKAYGSEQPISPSITRTGRKRNERVELHRLIR